MPSKNKNGKGSWGNLYGMPMEGWRFAMISMKKLQDILDEGYALVLLSNGNVCVLLTFKNFWQVLLFQTPYITI